MQSGSAYTVRLCICGQALHMLVFIPFYMNADFFLHLEFILSPL